MKSAYILPTWAPRVKPYLIRRPLILWAWQHTWHPTKPGIIEEEYENFTLSELKKENELLDVFGCSAINLLNFQTLQIDYENLSLVLRLLLFLR